MAVFYRAVSFAELTDIRGTGELRSIPGTCEGKHMAMTKADAMRWGEGLHGVGRFTIIRITVDDASSLHFMQWDRLDSIGPACFATIENLAGASVAEVIDES